MNLILGTMTFGQQVFEEEAKMMTELFLSKGYNELDTAYVYNEGECERLLGNLLKGMDRSKVRIATKVNPRISGKLDGDAVRKQLPESLERMGIEKADVFYLHFPDPKTPIESVLEACDEMHRAGKFTELGISNFPAWMVADVWHKCKARGMVMPTVYEGVYNPLTRKAETELFSALRNYKMRFCAYNPLAGGMLTGRYKSVDETPTEGRFVLRKAYPSRYWKQSFFEALDILREVCGEISLVEATYRWLAFHSELKEEQGDGILIGASKYAQLEQNIAAIENGPLPENIVDAFDRAWQHCKADAPEYFTLYRG